MNNKINSKKIALAGIATAGAIIAILIGYYVPNISLSMNVIAGIALILPLTQGWIKEAILSFIAASLLGAIFVNLHIFVFVIGTGSFTLFAIIAHRKQLKLFIKIIIDAIWASVALALLYQLLSLITVDFSEYDFITLSPTALYISLNAIFIAGFILYDYLLVWIYKYLSPIIAKLKL